MAAAVFGVAGAADVAFEDLGAPILIRELAILAVTPKAGGGHVAWGWRKQEALVGIDVATGKSFRVDMRKHGAVNIALAPGPDGSLFFYAGSPGRYFKYTPEAELVELGVAAEPASYWTGGHKSSRDVLYVGTYPDAVLVACDMTTGKVTSHGRMTEDKRQKYVIRVAAADDGVVYSAVGLHHEELWSLDPSSGQRRQLLPEAMTARQGAPRIWTGTDGHVYGRSGGTTYRCRPDGIDEGQTCAARSDPLLRRAGVHDVAGLDEEGRLRLVSVGDKGVSYVQTDYEGRAPAVFSIGCERAGRIYGGTVFPGRAFCYDPGESRFRELDAVTPRAIQIYDIFSGERGLLFASYMGCLLDFFDPDAPREPGANPRRFKGGIPGHERPVQWERGPDGKLYFGTVPAKGRLGGALVRVDPETLETRVWPQVVPDQSIMYLCSVTEAGQLFGCASVSGGSSAIPSQEEADVFLWDTKTEAVAWRGRPLPGTRSYGRAVRARNGLIAGVAGGSWYLFDPVSRATVHTGELPVERVHFPGLSDVLLGAAGLAVGLGDDAVFAIDADSRTVEVLGRHHSLRKAHGFLVAADGTLYYGSGSSVWRCRLGH